MLYEKIMNRRSERNFSEQKITQQSKQKMVDVINSTPTSINGQAFSAIWIEDQKIKDEISKLNWGQPHISQAAAVIIFVSDMKVIKQTIGAEFQNLTAQMRAELIAVGAVDATISASMLTTYLLEQNMGSCFLGGVRTYPEQLKQLLNLDDDLIPVVGLAIGYIDAQNDIRPKKNKVYFDRYEPNQAANDYENYDAIMLKDYQKRDMNVNWSENTKNTYVNFNKANGYDAIFSQYKKIID